MNTENITQEAGEAAAEAGNKIQSSVNSYIDRLVEGHERMARALETTRERNGRVADKFFEAVIGGQREALELTRTVAAQPTAFGKNMEAVVQSLTNNQERTIELAKTVYREQAEATAEARDMVEPFIPNGEALGKPFQKISEMWNAAAK